MKHIEGWREYDGVNGSCIEIKDFYGRKTCKVERNEVMIGEKGFSMNC